MGLATCNVAQMGINCLCQIGLVRSLLSNVDILFLTYLRCQLGTFCFLCLVVFISYSWKIMLYIVEHKEEVVKSNGFEACTLPPLIMIVCGDRKPCESVPCLLCSHTHSAASSSLCCSTFENPPQLCIMCTVSFLCSRVLHDLCLSPKALSSHPNLLLAVAKALA